VPILIVAAIELYKYKNNPSGILFLEDCFKGGVLATEAASSIMKKIYK